MRAYVGLALGAMLTAPALAAPPVGPNPFNDRLARLSPVDRAAALRRAVTEGNGQCGRLDANTYRGPWGNLRLWQVHCQPGGDYAVYLGPGGEVQVRTCAELKTLRLPQCSLPPKR